jgi:hypothetical protein
MEKREKPEAKDLQGDRYADFEPAPAPTMGPSGQIAVGFVGSASPAPSWTPEEVICARGPCRHLWVLKTTVGEGNPAGTWDDLGIPQPRQLNYTCLVNPGMETEFLDDAAIECNLWDPLTEDQIEARESRRRLYQIRVAREQPPAAPVERVEDAVDDGDAVSGLPVGGDADAAIAKETARAWFVAGRGDYDLGATTTATDFEELWAQQQKEEEKES